MVTDVGRIGCAETGSREPGLASRPGPTGFDPARVRLALDRVGNVLNEVDYGCGHFITGDNLKIMDVQILHDLAKAANHD